MSGQNSDWSTAVIIVTLMAITTTMAIWGPPEIAGVIGFVALIFLIGVFG